MNQPGKSTAAGATKLLSLWTNTASSTFIEECGKVCYSMKFQCGRKQRRVAISANNNAVNKGDSTPVDGRAQDLIHYILYSYNWLSSPSSLQDSGIDKSSNRGGWGITGEPVMLIGS